MQTGEDIKMRQENKIKVGDLVVNTDEPEHGVGIVLEVNLDMWGQPQEPPGIKVLWRNPTWHDPTDGGSVMYQDEVRVISESR